MLQYVKSKSQTYKNKVGTNTSLNYLEILKMESVSLEDSWYLELMEWDLKFPLTIRLESKMKWLKLGTYYYTKV